MNSTFKIFRNTNATDENRQPHYNGSIEISGVEHKIAIWARRDKNNQWWYSGNIQEPVNDMAPPPHYAQQHNDNDLPF